MVLAARPVTGKWVEWRGEWPLLQITGISGKILYRNCAMRKRVLKLIKSITLKQAEKSKCHAAVTRGIFAMSSALEKGRRGAGWFFLRGL